MLGLYVTVPVACFRKGLAREYLETERVPPPSTCYGFLLSLVGETDIRRHVGVRVTPVVIGDPKLSVVLRTLWRVKKRPLGSAGNVRPDYQQLLTGVELVIWLDSSGDNPTGPTLEDRVQIALDPDRRKTLIRFGGLSLGESTHMVDTVSLLTADLRARLVTAGARIYLTSDSGLLTLPVWVDHVGSAGTVYATGDFVMTDLSPPESSRTPRIRPKEF